MTCLERVYDSSRATVRMSEELPGALPSDTTREAVQGEVGGQDVGFHTGKRGAWAKDNA